MTEQQIRWAKSHDWYIATLASGEGVLVLDAYVLKGVLYQDSKAFIDYYKLRAWAGY